MRNLLLIILTSTLFMVQAQDFNDYQSLSSTGKVPEDFIKKSSDKFKDSHETAKEKGEKRFTKKSKKKFLLKTSFELNDVLFGGKVLFNDTLSNYVNSVADEVLKENSTLRKELRFYILKSSAVNAFTTNDGMIFVTMGLLSQVENEAQLAFVLCHEIAHFNKQHVINKYVEDQKIIHNKGYSVSNYKDKLIRSNQYSQELETEADLLGCDLFLKSSYNDKGIERIFDVLKYSYLPFDDVEFDTTFFEHKEYEIPSSYWVNEVKEIAIEDDYDASKSSHPSTEVRKEKILSKLEGVGSTKSTFSLNGTDYFDVMQRMARYEVAKILMYEGRYEHAVYHTYLLLLENPESYFLNKVMTFSLYYKYMEQIKNNSSTDDYDDEMIEIETYTSVEGESQQVYSLLQKMPRKELGILSLRKAVEAYQKFDDKVFKAIMVDVIYNLNKANDVTFASFKKSYPQNKVEVATTENLDNDTLQEKKVRGKLSKIDKIKQSRKPEEKEEIVMSTSSYYRYALVDFMDKEEALKVVFEEAIKIATHSKEIEKRELSYSQKKKRKKRVRKKGHHFGIDSLVVINPRYSVINFKKKQAVRYLDAEGASEDLNKAITENAEASGLDVQLLDDMELGQKTINQYNDMMFLSNWMMHRTTLLVDQDTSLFVSFDQEMLKDIRSRYHSDYCAWMGFTYVREKKSGVGLYFLSSIFYGITLPYAIYYAVTPKQYLTTYMLMFDTTNGQMVWIKVAKYKNSDNKAVINSIVYDSFRQIKSKK